MVSSETLSNLCNFWSSKGEALSLYFNAGHISELSHRKERPLLKEKIQRLYGGRKGSSVENREDLKRLLNAISSLNGNHRLSKVIFACGSQSIWHEINLPLQMPTRLSAGNRFLLMPLASTLSRLRRCCIALMDRRVLRLFLLVGDSLREPVLALQEPRIKPDKWKKLGFKKHFSLMPGTGGSEKKQRHKDADAKRHFQFSAEQTGNFVDRHRCDCLILGCRNEVCSEIETELTTGLRSRLIGYIDVDPGLATTEEVKAQGLELIASYEAKQDQNKTDAAYGESGRNGLGALGFAAVCDALNKGEAAEVLVSATASAACPPVASAAQFLQLASMCRVCSHLVAEVTEKCEVCGGIAEIFSEPHEAILRKAMLQDVIVRQVADLTHQVAALLRFRAEARSA